MKVAGNPVMPPPLTPVASDGGRIRRTIFRAAGVCALSLAVCCCGHFEGKAAPQERKMMTDKRPFAIGRFQFSMPESLVVASRKQSIYRVDVRTEELPSAGGGAQAVWGGIMADVHAVQPSPVNGRVVIREFDLKPGVRAVWYFRNPEAPKLLNLEALKAFPDHVLLLVRGCETGKEEPVEKLVGNVATAYAPGAMRGFCLGRGCITSEPGNNEDTTATFRSRTTPELELSFETHTVGNQVDVPMSQMIDELKAQAGASGSVQALRQSPRKSAGLTGEEALLSVSDGKKPFATYRWHFPGVTGNSFAPEIGLVGTVPIGGLDALTKVVDEILNSFQPVPRAE
jgi:hypothetical protein